MCINAACELLIANPSHAVWHRIPLAVWS